MSEAMQLIAELPEDDQRLKHDSLEGETRYFAIMDDLAEAALADTKLVELAKERIKRLEARSALHRDIIKRMLEVVGLQKTERPLYTASTRHGQELIEVPTNEELPAAFVRTAPDRILIGKTLRHGDAVPGYELHDKSDLVLTLRTA